jgi:hypothetical protein
VVKRNSPHGALSTERLTKQATQPAGAGRSWWAHFEFTRINIEPIILYKKIEDVRKVDATSPKHCSVRQDLSAHAPTFSHCAE